MEKKKEKRKKTDLLDGRVGPSLLLDFQRRDFVQGAVPTNGNDVEPRVMLGFQYAEGSPRSALVSSIIEVYHIV